MLPCTGPGAYPAAWISGVTRAPPATAGTLLIASDDYCVTGTGDATTAEGFGLAEYDPAGNLLGPVTTVFSTGSGLPLLKQQVLGSPVLGRDGYLYLFAPCRADLLPAGCGRGRVFLARTVAAPAYWRNPLPASTGRAAGGRRSRRRRTGRGRPVPCPHGAPGTQHPQPPADLLLRPGKRPRGRGRLPVVKVTAGRDSRGTGACA